MVGQARQQVTSQLSDQATTGRDRLSETLRTLGEDLQQMAEGQGPAQGMATDLAREVSDRVRALGSHLEDRDPSQLLEDARSFARRRPGTFLLGALAAGVVAGRLFRATADGAAAASLVDSASTGTTGSTGSTGATYGTTGTTGTTYSSAGLETGTTGTSGTTYGSTGVGTGPMTTASGSAALAGEPGDSSFTESGTDPVSDALPGQRTQDLP